METARGSASNKALLLGGLGGGVRDLSGYDLHDTDLGGANLSGQILTEANLIGTDLSGADLTHAHLSDDLHARRAATRLGVPITGTVGILAACVRRGYLALAEANGLLEAMIAAGYRSPIVSLDQLLELDRS